MKPRRTSNVKELAKDSLLYGASSVLSQFASLILVPFYTRALQPREYGVLAIATMYLAFIGPVATLGMDGALFRFYSLTDNPEKKLQYVSTANILKLSAVLAMLGAFIPFYSIISSSLFAGQLTQNQFGLVLGTFAVDSITALSLVVLRSERKVTTIAVNNILVLLVSMGLSIYFVLVLKMRIEGALLASLLASIFRVGLFLRITLKTFSFRNFRPDVVKELLSYGLPVIPHKVQGQAITLFTLFMINNKLGIAAAGLYAVAQKMSKPLSLFVGMFQQSWVPYKFQIHKQEKSPEKVFCNLITLYWIILLFLWGVVSIAAPLVFKILVDKKYWAGIPYVPFAMLLCVAQGFYFTVTTGFELSPNQKKMVNGSFWGLVTMLAASLITLSFPQPYAFMLCQSLAFVVLATVLFPEARRMIHIHYPFAKAAALFCFTSLCIALAYLGGHPLFTVLAGLLLVGGFAVFSHNMLPPGYLVIVKAMWVRARMATGLTPVADAPGE